jgi:hypothetical protein
MKTPRLISTFLPDGTTEGIRIIELSESSIKAFLIPRIKLSDIKNRPEIKQPALYLLINSADNQLYIGESENFFDRIKNHDQAKDFWDLAIAIVSNTNSLEKGDVKYLESLAVEKALSTAAMQVLNKTIPIRNNVHEFKVHSLQTILDDTAMIAESLGYSIFSSKDDDTAETWYCSSKKSQARAQFRGNKFVVLAGSIIDKSFTPSWAKFFPHASSARNELFKKYGIDLGETVELIDNMPQNSPNEAASNILGRSVNAWTTWKNKDGKTMDEVMRKGEK